MAGQSGDWPAFSITDEPQLTTPDEPGLLQKRKAVMKQETCSIPQTEPVTPKLETIRVQLPGRIVGAEGENVVRIEVCIGGPSLIRLSSLDECCSGSLNQPEIDELLHRLERMAGCEVFKSMIRIG